MKNGGASARRAGIYVGGPPPVAPFKHIDADAMIKDMRTKTFAQSAYAFLYVLGLLLIMGSGCMVLREHGLRIAVPSAIGIGIAYAIIVSILRRYRDHRAQESMTVQRLKGE